MKNFTEIKTNYPAYTAKSTQEYFEKWGMKRMITQTFKYTNHFDVTSKEDFVKSFLKESASLKTFSSSNNIVPLNLNKFNRVSVEVLSSSIINMSFFDRLFDHGIVRKGGSISKCFDSVIDDILISDELRELILNPNSKCYDIFSEKERNEFIFQLFQHLVLGGYCCQYEDDVQPYIDLTKHLYKDFLYVFKDVNTSKLVIGSIVLKVSVYDQDDNYLFPGKQAHIQNFFYLILDPVKREMLLWSHLWDV